MKKLLNNKTVVFLIALAGLVALALLAAALRDLKFQPAAPVSFNFGSVQVSGAGFTGPPDIAMWRYLLFAALAILIVAIIFVLLDPELRKKLLLRVVQIVIWMLAIGFLLNFAFENGKLNQQSGDNGGPPGWSQSTFNQGDAPVYSPPEISPWVTYTVSFAIGLGLTAVGWLIYSRRQKNSGSSARFELAGIARQALEELKPGGNWDDAIIKAYVRMNEVVVSERGLLRQPGNTPREFALRMERVGLPGEAVRTLTSLFEGVRYGNRSSSLTERDLAAAALSAIVHALGRDA